MSNDQNGPDHSALNTSEASTSSEPEQLTPAGSDGSSSVVPGVGAESVSGGHYSMNAPYSPPRVESETTAQRSSTPLIIGLFTVAIVALLVIAFIAIQALTAVAEAEWSLPELPAPEAEGPEYVQPERGPADPNATKGMGEGKYEVPTDPWLHSGYAAGASQWTASGSYIGVSKDKAVIAFKDHSADAIIGYDVKTGAEKWRTSIEVRSFILCLHVWNGIAYCSDDAITDSETHQVFTAIDLATGEQTQIGNSPVEGDSAEFLGYWQGHTYWMTSVSTEAFSADARAPYTLIALKDGKMQWHIDVAANARCRVGDGAIGCQQTQTDESNRVELINASTGEFVAEYTGAINVNWYRDGYVIMNDEAHKTEYRQYLWTGEDLGTISPTGVDGEPRESQGNLVPMSSVGGGVELGFVDPTGKSLLKTSPVDGDYTYFDVSTKKVIATKEERMEAVGDQKGKVYLLTGVTPKAFFFVDENGTQILSGTYGDEETITVEHGILLQKNSSDEVTVFAPQG
ncbi:MAG: hypothetical protein Q4C87_01450 [Actinomycetaceae bacterium]|nr:hypothetical protein [Actinomycetaceae bacterium]